MSSTLQNTQQDAPIPTVQLPTVDKFLLSCKNCHRVLTEYQFTKEGCRGCHPKGNAPIPKHKLNNYATGKFSGYVGIVDPSMSWVARVIGLGKKAPMGVYAAQVDSEGEDDEEEEAMDEEEDFFGREVGGNSRLSRNSRGAGDEDLPENPFEVEERAAKKSRPETSGANGDVDEYERLLDGLLD
eukprot:GDKK01001234.1.p1 GENE.GDKK01001234.1~~GDKK01001234.1.p1  ORF type:complete len:197 (+),score=32.25 GDKK01001234.1:42-593(+)